MDAQVNHQIPTNGDMARPIVTGGTTSYSGGLSDGRSKWSLILSIPLILILFLIGWFLISRSSTNSSLQNLKSQVATLEQKAGAGPLSADDKNTLNNLQANLTKLEQKTTNLPDDTKAQLADLTTRLDKLEANTTTIGPKGATGATGSAGATGSQGAQGIAGSNDCLGGVCVSRQTTSPGTVETGNINLSGAIIATSFQGNGANLTSLNGSNISSGTLSDARLSANVTLQGNSFNGVSQLVQLTAGGILPVLDGSNLTSLTGANVNGTVANATTAGTTTGNAGTATALATNPTDCAANTYAVTIATSGNLTCASITDGSLTANVTLQGNSFNGANQLVQLTAGGILPVLNGSNLTSLNATNIASGTLADTRLSTNAALLNGTQTFSAANTFSAAGTALTVTNTASIGTLSVTGNATITGTLGVTGNTTLSANLTVVGSVTAASYTRSCPTGYVPVPGNPKFGTSDFCVMKYEAKDDGSGNAVSTATGTPWVSISQITSQDKSLAASGRLLSEAEWMTIATNALWVNANWCSSDGSACGNAPGTAGKVLATGHQDNSPAQALVASTTDTEACFGTVTAGVNTACGSAGTQKRTLTLSNGSVIWDIPGNVWEWTDAWIIGNEHPTTATPGFSWREFTAITKWQGLQYANPTNRGWNSAQGLGQIYSDGTSTNNTQYAFRRSGSWSIGSPAGAFALILNYAPTDTDVSIGFRVAR